MSTFPQHLIKFSDLLSLRQLDILHLLRAVLVEGEAVLVGEGAQQLHGALAADLGHAVEHERHFVVVHRVVEAARLQLQEGRRRGM